MAALTGQSIASSYEQILHVDRNGGGNTTTLVSIKDGDNESTFGFQISTNALMMTSTNQLQFGDTGTYIHQSADGVLDLVSDTELELNATTIDINGAVEVSGHTIIESTSQLRFGDTGTYIHQSADGVLDLVSDTELELNATTIDINGAVEVSGNLTHSGDVIIDADDKALVLGADQDVSIFANNAGEIYFVRGQDYSPASGDVEGWIAMTLGNSSSTSLDILGGEGGSSTILMHSDGGDDDADKWKLTVADGGGITFNYASTGSYVTHLKLDANSRISLSNNDSGGTGGADSTTGNTVFGYFAGTAIASGGTNNSVFGHKAGTAITTGDNNIAIGANALDAETTGNENIAIGKNALGVAANGELSNVVIGNEAGNAINDAGADYNVIIGSGAGQGGTGAMAQCVAIGLDAMNSTAGNAQAGTVAIGSSSLTALTSGGQNIAVGHGALGAQTTGGGNTALGHEALNDLNHANADSNTAIGAYAGATGTNDLVNANTNTFIGYSTSGASASAVNQTVIGASAVGKADNSVMLGNTSTQDVYIAGYNSFRVDGAAFYVGSATSADKNTSLQLRTNDAPAIQIDSSQRVGIGTTTPTSKLEIATDTDDTVMYLSTHHDTDAAHPNLIFRKSGGSEASPSAVADNELLGDIEWHGFHTDYEPAAKIHAEIDGTPGADAKPGALVFSTTAASANSVTEHFRIASDGTLTATDTTIASNSDERLKKNISDYSGGLNIIKQLRPIEYEYKSSFRRKGKLRGFIAQEVKATDSYFAVEQIINELDNDGNANPEYEFVKDTDGITYLSKLNDKDSMYVSAIKELLTTIETLESRVAALEG